MTNQITKAGRTTGTYNKPACWSYCMVGLICIVVCIWIIRLNSFYQNPPTVSQSTPSPTPFFDTLSHKHLYSVHQPVHIVIHTGNSPASSTVSIFRPGVPLHLPPHLHTVASTPQSMPQAKLIRKVANAKTLPVPPIATSTPNVVLSLSLPPTATSIPTPTPTATSIPTPTPTSTPIASLSTIPQQSAPLPLSSVEPSPTETPLPTLDIEATPIQGKATPEPVFSKSTAVQLPEPGTPVSGH